MADFYEIRHAVQGWMAWWANPSRRMKQTEILDRLQALVEPVVADLGYELVEIQFRNEQVGQVLRLVIHKAGGISLDDCTRVSREVGTLLEVEDLIEGKYHLEVSSPGLDRPLRTGRDFARNLGQKVKVVLVDAEGQQRTLEGRIAAVDEAAVVLGGEEDGERTTVPLAAVRKARLVIEF